jgi:hypothetical protein
VGAQRKFAPARVFASAWRPSGRFARAAQGLPDRHDRVRRSLGARRPGSDVHDLAGVPGPAGGGRRDDAAEHSGAGELGLRPLGGRAGPRPHGRGGRRGRCAWPHDWWHPDRRAELARCAAGERASGRHSGASDAPRRAEGRATAEGGARRSARSRDAGSRPLRPGPGVGSVTVLGLGVTAGARGPAGQRRVGRHLRVDRTSVAEPAAELRPAAPPSELPGRHDQPGHRRHWRDGARPLVPAAADPQLADVSRPGRPRAAANDAPHGDHRAAGRTLVRQDWRPVAAGHRFRGADPVRAAAGRRDRVQLVPGDPAGLVRVRCRTGAGPDRERPGVAGHRPDGGPGAGLRRIGHRRAVRRRDWDRDPLPGVPRGLHRGSAGQHRPQPAAKHVGSAADQAQGRAAGGRANWAEGTQLPGGPREIPRAGAQRLGSRLRGRIPGRKRGRPDRPRRDGGHGPAGGCRSRRKGIMPVACSPPPLRWSASGRSATPADTG